MSLVNRSGWMPLFNTNDPASWCSDWQMAELDKSIANSEAKRQNAQKRWQKNNGKVVQMHSNSNANASKVDMQMQCPSPSPSPSPSLTVGEVEDV